MPLGGDQTIGCDVSQKLEALLQQARADRAAGCMAEARAAYELAVAKARAIDDRTLLAQALRHVSDMERERGNRMRLSSRGKKPSTSIDSFPMHRNSI